jgi:hypothetical protein
MLITQILFANISGADNLYKIGNEKLFLAVAYIKPYIFGISGTLKAPKGDLLLVRHS